MSVFPFSLSLAPPSRAWSIDGCFFLADYNRGLYIMVKDANVPGPKFKPKGPRILMPEWDLSDEQPLKPVPGDGDATSSTE